jgi:hypothetical protein
MENSYETFINLRRKLSFGISSSEILEAWSSKP